MEALLRYLIKKRVPWGWLKRLNPSFIDSDQREDFVQEFYLKLMEKKEKLDSMCMNDRQRYAYTIFKNALFSKSSRFNIKYNRYLKNKSSTIEYYEIYNKTGYSYSERE